MNTTLGAKIIWQMISGNRSWWKDALRKKYLNGNRVICLSLIPNNPNVSPIWKLCQKSVFVIQEDLRWATGNGRKIQIWEDVMNITQQCEKIVDLKNWMDTQDISTISDLSSWHSSGRWAGWRSLEMPDHLKMDYNQLQSLLQGSLPIHINLKDSRS